MPLFKAIFAYRDSACIKNIYEEPVKKGKKHSIPLGKNLKAQDT